MKSYQLELEKQQMQTEYSKKVWPKRMRFSRIFLRTICAMLFLAVGVSVVLVLIMQAIARERNEKNIYYNALTNLSTVIKSADNEFSALSTEASLIFRNEACNALLAEADQSDSMQTVRVAQFLFDIVSEDQNIEEICLALPHEDRLITSRRENIPLESSRLSLLYSRYSAAPNHSVRDFTLLYADGLYLVKEFPVEKPLGVLFLKISSNTFWNRCYADNTSGLLYPYLEKTPAFPEQTTYPSAGVEIEPLNQTAELKSGNLYRSKSTGEYIVTTESSYSGLEYVLFVPNAPLSSDAVTVYIVTFVFWTLILLVLVSMYLSRRVYRPIHALLESIKISDRAETMRLVKESTDEIDFLQKKNAAERERESELSDMLKSVGASIGERIFRDAVNGQNTDEASFDRVFENAGLPFRKEGNYRVFSIALHYENDEIPDVLERELHWIAIEKWIREYWAEALGCVFHAQNRNVTVACSADSDGACERFRAAFSQYAREFGLVPVIGASDNCTRLLRLNRAKIEADESLRRMLYYQDQYTDDTESRRREFVRILDKAEQHPERVTDSIEELFDRLCKTPNGQQDCLLLADMLTERMLRLNIQSTAHLIAVRKESGLPLDQTQLLKLRSFCIEADQEIRSAVLQNQFQYVQEAKKYIQTHFGDSSVSLDSVSEACGISASYLSKLFSVYEAPGFLSYLNQYRLEQACRLLSSTEETTADVGFMAGFNSPQSFNRVFKRYFNETPGQYRTRCRKEKAECLNIEE